MELFDASYQGTLKETHDEVKLKNHTSSKNIFVRGWLWTNTLTSMKTYVRAYIQLKCLHFTRSVRTDIKLYLKYPNETTAVI